MSSLKDTDKLCAKLSVKVPQPDSLVEVRVTPPDSNFEVKVLPGEEVIELIIRPVGSLIEVRIGPSVMEPAEAGQVVDVPVEAALEPAPEPEPALDCAAEEVSDIPLEAALEPAPEPEPALDNAEVGAGEAPGEETLAAIDPDFDEDPEEVSAVPDSAGHLISGAAGPAVLAALARLSAAVGEERAALDNVLEARSQPAQPEPAQPEPVPPGLEEAAGEPPEESDPAEHQDEELAIGPMDVQDLAGVDLDQSQPDGPDGGDGPVVKAKPLVKAIVPAS
jgi:hypothetical protein